MNSQSVELIKKKLVAINPPKSLLIHLYAEAISIIKESQSSFKKRGLLRWENTEEHNTYREIKKNWLMLRKKSYFEIRGNKTKFVGMMLEIYGHKVKSDGEYLLKLIRTWEKEYVLGDLASKHLQLKDLKK